MYLDVAILLPHKYNSLSELFVGSPGWMMWLHGSGLLWSWDSSQLCSLWQMYLSTNVRSLDESNLSSLQISTGLHARCCHLEPGCLSRLEIPYLRLRSILARGRETLNNNAFCQHDKSMVMKSM